jgi:signal transduction histidine kinase
VFLKQLAGRRDVSAGEQRADSAPLSERRRIDLGDLAIAQLVHDLQNRLAVTIGSAKRIRETVGASEAVPYIEDIQDAARLGMGLTRELLMSVRPHPIIRRRVNLNEVVAGAAAMLKRVTDRNITLRLRLCDDPLPVCADVTEIDRILLNLALNARDAMERGGVLSIETGWVDPSLHAIEGARRCSHVRLAVSDTGSGMTPEVRARMFEPFFTTKDSSTGLGLCSVSYTVQQLGGVVTVDTQLRRGTSVTIALPAADRLGLESPGAPA